MAKTNFSDGNEKLGILGTIINAVLMNKLIKPFFSSKDEDGHFAIGYEDVRAYGAKINGVDDDTAAIQAAIDAAASGSGCVYCPKGTYKINVITIPANVKLKGAGMGLTIFKRTYAYVPGAGAGQNGLFSIQLTGSFAELIDCTYQGLWNPATPTTQTYDGGICIVGDNVKYCKIKRVESSNCHIGFWTGGVIGSPSLSWGGQDSNTFSECYAHHTFDNGFSIAGKDRTTGINRDNHVLDCRQHDSYSQCGIEIRFNDNAKIVNFTAENNDPDELVTGVGGAIRFESADNALAENIVAIDCEQAIQFINDSFNCRVKGLTVDGGCYGVMAIWSEKCSVDRFVIKNVAWGGIVLGWTDGNPYSWTKRNSFMTFSNGLIQQTGVSHTGRGFYVVGTAPDSDIGENGNYFTLKDVVFDTPQYYAIDIRAGHGWQVTGCVIKDAAAVLTTNGEGIHIEPTQISSVPQASSPTGGIIDNVTFIRSGDAMPKPIGDTTGTANHRTTMLGLLKFVGTFAAYPVASNLVDIDGSIWLRHQHGLPRGLVLDQELTGQKSPMLFFRNTADNKCVSLAMHSNGALEISTDATPETSQGTLAAYITSAGITTASGKDLQSGNDVKLSTGKALRVNNVKVVGDQQTGVAAMTNVSTPANLDADTVTVAQLADIVGTLINKIRAHGLVTD